MRGDGRGGGRRRPAGLPQQPTAELDAHAPQPLGGLGPPIDPRIPYKNAEDLGDQLEGFHVSGGRTFWRTAAEVAELAGDERFAGFQVLASLDIPKGNVGFIKGVSASPVFLEQPGTFEHTDPQDEESPLFPVAPTQAQVQARGAISNPCCSFWQTPQGWESAPRFDDQTGEPIGPPAATWEWGLIAFQGSGQQARASYAAVSDQVLAPNIPIPLAAIAGMPFESAVGYDFGHQPQQRIGLVQAANQTHLLVRPNTFLVLYARWTQVATLITLDARREAVMFTSEEQQVGTAIYPRPPGATSVLFVSTSGNIGPIAMTQQEANGTPLEQTDITTGSNQTSNWLLEATTQVELTMGGPPDPVRAVWLSDLAPGLSLGPSIGALHGFVQKTDRAYAKVAARLAGWG